MRILFQGDSITDVGRDRRNYHDMGNGYPKYVAEKLSFIFPYTDIEFINMGISGNRTCQLFDRLYPDAVDFQPDVISILIGVNDIWHRQHKVMTTDEQIEANYRSILKELRASTNAKIVILAPFCLDAEDKDYIRNDLPTVIRIVEKLAHEYADAYIPLNEIFDAAIKNQPEPLYYSPDGVHPNENGARFIADHYCDAVVSIINELI